MRHGALLVVALFAGGCSATPTTAGSSPEPLHPDAVIELPGEPGALLVHGSAVWVTQPRCLARVSIRRQRLTRRIRLGMTPYDIVAGHGSLWVVGMLTGRERITREGRYPVIHVTRIEPRTGRVLARIPVPARSNGNRLAATAQDIWLTDPAEGASSRILAIDPRTHRVRPMPSGQEPTTLVPDRGGVWSANHDDGTLRLQDDRTALTLRSTRLPGEPHGLAVASGSLWVADGHHDRILEVARDSLEIVRRIGLGHETGPLTPAGRGGVWATAPSHHPEATRLRRIDPGGRIAQTVVAGDPVVDFASRARTLWVATTGRELLRVPE
jgi:hypothetical protein